MEARDFSRVRLHQMENDNGSKPTGGCGCCGPTVAMFLIGILMPVILTVVFVAH